MSEKKEKEIRIDLSWKIKFGDTFYISIGSFLLSFFVALLQFLMALIDNNGIITSRCLIVFLNFIYVIRAGVSYNSKQILDYIDKTMVLENKNFINAILERIKKIEEKESE